MPRHNTILPLIDILCLLGKYKGISIEPYALQSASHTTDAIFHVLARMGLPTRTLTLPLNALLEQTFPCVLILKSVEKGLPNRAGLLLGREDGKYRIILSDNAPSQSLIPENDLNNIYTGYVVFSAIDEEILENIDSSEENANNKKNWFWQTLLNYAPLYRNVFFSSILINCFVLASPLFVMNVYDRVIPNNAMDTLWVLAIGVCIAYLSDFILKILRSYFVDLAGKEVDTIVSSRIMEKLLNIKIAHLPKTTGSLINNVREFEQIRDFIGSTTLLALVDIPFTFLFILLIWWLAGSLVFIPLSVLPVMLLLSWIFQISLKKSIDKQVKQNELKNSILIDSMVGIETVKTNLLQGFIQDKYENSCMRSAETSSHSKRLNMLAVSSNQFVGALANTGLIVFGAYLISLGNISMGALIACVILMGRVVSSLIQFASVILIWQKTKTAKKKLDNIMMLEEENQASSTLILPSIESTFSSSLKVENLSFSYPNSDELVLDNISLEIKAGEKVALVGKSGAGKSTLLKLIMRLYEGNQGRVLLDNLDTRHIHTSLLRGKIGYLSQDTYLFSGTIIDNISMGMLGVSQHRIMKAAEISGVLDFTKNFSKGLMTDVGERGKNLSGGQKQAIALARTLIRDPQVLLLDEPTSSLDDESEKRFIERAKRAFADRTVILSSHKSALYSLTSRAIVLNQGKLITESAQILKK